MILSAALISLLRFGLEFVFILNKALRIAGPHSMLVSMMETRCTDFVKSVLCSQSLPLFCGLLSDWEVEIA